MSINVGPELTESGLVFHYDMYNTQKSWKGAPATNAIINSQTAENWSPFNITVTTNTILAPDNTLTADTGTSTSAFANSNFGNLQVVTSNSASYTYSVYVKAGTLYSFRHRMAFSGGSTPLGFSIDVNLLTGTIVAAESGYSDASITSLNNGWFRVSITAANNSTSNTNCIQQLYFGALQPGVLGSLYVWGAQCELGIIATTYIPTFGASASRSITQSILDLSYNNTSITANSLTYASNNTFSFNGSTDYLSAAAISTAALTGYTISFWAQRDAENKMAISTGSFYWYGDNSWKYTHGGVNGEYYYPKPTSIPISTWGHYCATYNGSTVTIYRQGIYQGQQATTGTADWNLTILIGKHSSASYEFLGKISTVSIYDRALTALEVQQNFNAIRGRYSI